MSPVIRMDYRVSILKERIARYFVELEKKNIRLLHLKESLNTHRSGCDLIQNTYYIKKWTILIEICNSEILELQNEIDYLSYQVDKMNAEGVCNSME